MAHREIKDWERCGMSGLTGVHGWQLIIDNRGRYGLYAVGLSCAFCNVKPPTVHVGSLFRKHLEMANETRRHKGQVHLKDGRTTGRRQTDQLECRHCHREVTPVLVWQTFENDTDHLRANCPRCGHMIQYLRQHDDEGEPTKWLALAPERQQAS